MRCRARSALIVPRICSTLAAVEAMAPATASVITASRLRSQSTAYDLPTRFEYACTKSAAALLPREKDFIALTSDFKTWSRHMADKYDLYLEIQRGGWESRCCS